MEGRAIYHIKEAKRVILKQLGQVEQLPKRRLYSSELPASLITGALARLESERRVEKVLSRSGEEYYRLRRPSLREKLLGILAK